MRGARAALAAGLVAAWVGLGVPARAADVTLGAAGDIACGANQTADAADCQQNATATLMKSLAPTAVAALGDEQYETVNDPSDAQAPYDWTPFHDSWGAFDDLIHPAPGNHEYHQAGAAGYFSYFDPELRAFDQPSATDPSQGWYSYDLGAWHVVALNSSGCDTNGNCNDAVNVPQAEVDWLNADLAAHPGQCTLAYWHHPLFATPNDVFGGPGAVFPQPPHYYDEPVVSLWQALYAHHADVVLNGHEHNYERFALQNPQGVADPTGIREFVVGTGGDNHHTFAGSPVANSQVQDDEDFGVLLMTLHGDSYDWRFVGTNGLTADQGTTLCHHPHAAISVQPADPVAGQTITLSGAGSADGQGGSLSSYSWDLNDDGVYRDATGPTTSVELAQGTHTVGLRVADAAGVTDTAQTTITVGPAPPPPASAPAAAPTPLPVIAVQDSHPARPVSLRSVLRGLLSELRSVSRSRLVHGTWSVAMPRAGLLRVEVRPLGSRRTLLIGRALARQPGRLRLRLRRTRGAGPLGRGPLVITAVVWKGHRTIAVMRGRA